MGILGKLGWRGGHQSRLLPLLPNEVRGLSFSRSQPDFKGFLQVLRFPPSRKNRLMPFAPGHKVATLPRGPKKLCFTTQSLIPMVSIARLSVVKQSSFGLPGQYGHRVTRVNYLEGQKYTSH